MKWKFSKCPKRENIQFINLLWAGRMCVDWQWRQRRAEALSWHQIESFSHAEAGTPYQRQLWTRISSEFLWQTISVLMHLKSFLRTSSPALSRHSSMSRMENIFAHIKYSLKTMFFVPCWEKLASSVSCVEHLNDQTQTFSLARHSRPCGGGQRGTELLSLPKNKAKTRTAHLTNTMQSTILQW